MDDNDEDVARIAKELERKYGNAYSGSDQAIRGFTNEYNKGSGYDENDTFIDNSEAVSDGTGVYVILLFIYRSKLKF